MILEEELPAVCPTADTVRAVVSRRIRWPGYVACTVKGRGLYWVLVGEPEARRALGIPKLAVNVHWIDLARDRESGGLL